MNRLRVSAAALALVAACRSIAGVDGKSQSAETGGATSGGTGGVAGVSIGGAAGTDASAGSGGIAGTGGISGSGGAAGSGGAGGSDGGAGCQAPNVVCNAVCVDLANDGANCGRCGRVCFSGTCENARCPIQTLASGVGVADQMALLGTYVYWPSSTGLTHQINKVSVLGGSVAHLYQGLDEISGLAVDNSGVYWAHRFPGDVLRVGIGGGFYDTLGNVGKYATRIALDATAVYVTNAGGDTVGGGVYRIPKAAGVTQYLIPNQFRTWGVAVDETNVYWVNSEPSGFNQVFVADKLTGQGITLIAAATGADSGVDVGVDDSRIYWDDVAWGILQRNKTGGAVTVLAPEPEKTGQFVTDKERVYWMTNSLTTSRVMTVNKDGTGLQTLAIGENCNANQCTAIAIDDYNVYWIAGYMLRATEK